MSEFNEICVFSADLRNILKYQISWKSVHTETNCSTQTDGQTDRKKHDEAKSRFS